MLSTFLVRHFGTKCPEVATQRRTYAMERLVQSLRTSMEMGGALALPKLLAWQPHGYE